MTANLAESSTDPTSHYPLSPFGNGVAVGSADCDFPNIEKLVFISPMGPPLEMKTN
jgi:hypothetical protein